MQHSTGSFTGSKDTQIFHQAWLPEGTPKAGLVIVHGLGEHGGRYTNLVNVLVPQGYTVYALDQRGHGRSAGQRGFASAWEDLRADVRSMVKYAASQLTGQPLFIMGHSLGGLVTLDYVLNHPDGLRGVITSAPALHQTAISPALLMLARILSGIMPSLSMKTNLDAAGISRDPAVVKAYLDDPLTHDLGTPRLGALADATMKRTLANAVTLKLPLLMIHGDADRLTPASGTQAFFAAAQSVDKRVIIYPGGYHESHNDIHHAQACADILAWLDEHL